jgi:solute carrier organic anion transporter family, member 3A
LQKLALNFRYTLLVLIMSVECILIALFTHYMVLYTQNIYQVSSSRSSILVGGVVVPSAIIGAVLGGILVKKFDLFIEGCTRLIIGGSIVVITGIFLLLFIKCTSQPSVGIDLKNEQFNKTFAACNVDCDCKAVYNPTCGIDQVSYVSPCYAGCKRVNATGYYECGCVQESLNSTHAYANTTLMATIGACKRDCDNKLILFLVILFVVIAAESICLTPATFLLMKLIDKPLQPFALGVMRMSNILVGKQ